jgi:hypothetical protein
MVHKYPRIGTLLLVALLTMGGTPSAWAQRVRAVRPKSPAATGTAGRTQLPATSGSVTLPAWVDDAETLDPGNASIELSVGRWSAIDGGETDGPVLDASVGVTSQLQLGVSAPYYRASYNDGYTSRGLGDTYLSAKYQLLDPSDGVVGVSVQPMLEVLSKAAVSDTTLGLKRVNWGLPLTVEVGSDETHTRAYATVGYFSRHAAVAGLGVERDIGSAATLVGMVTYSYATRASAVGDLAGLSRSRTDASGTVYVSVSPMVSLFAGAGRTVSRLDQNGARFMGSMGVRVETFRHKSRP